MKGTSKLLKEFHLRNELFELLKRKEWARLEDPTTLNLQALWHQVEEIPNQDLPDAIKEARKHLMEN